MESQQLIEIEKKIALFKKESELKTHWISLITHDLKEIFHSFLWLIEALENEMISKEDFFKMLPEIKEGAVKNLKTITDTTEWIKTQYGQFQPHLKEIFVFELFLLLQKENKNKLEEKNLSFEFQGNENLEITTDLTLALFIFNKILDNAIKYSYPDQKIYFQVFEDDHMITISIKDSGTGIKLSTIEKIFTFDTPKFYGTKGEKGAGLSLKIVKEFVQLLNATIDVSSQEIGTLVQVKFQRIQT